MYSTLIFPWLLTASSCLLRPPPPFGRADHVKIWLYNQVGSSPLNMDQVWQLSRNGSTSLFDPVSMKLETYKSDSLHLFTKDKINLSLESTTYFTTEVSFDVKELSPIESVYGVDEDPQYGAAQISLKDVDSNVEFGFTLTNNHIYAWYSKKSSFGFLIPISEKSRNEIVELSLGCSFGYIRDRRSYQACFELLWNSARSKVSSTRGFIRFFSPIFSLSFVPSISVQAQSLERGVCQQTNFDICEKYQNIQNALKTVCSRSIISLLRS